MNKIKIFLVIGWVFILDGYSWACWGFRPMAMGGTFVAVADDGNCAYWNRAGAAMLDNFRDGESELVITSNVYNSNGLFSRKERLGNTYYDSMNFAQRLGKDWGWTNAMVWNGGTSFVLSPGLAFRLPDFFGVLKNQAIGIGYYLWNIESYDGQKRVNTLLHQIHLDWLWRVTKEFSVGIHGENFMRLGGTSWSPDDPNYHGTVTATGPEKVNFRPSIAWWITPKWILNAGIYDLFNMSGVGPHYSIGTEYWLTDWFALRAGLYNFGGGGAGLNSDLVDAAPQTQTGSNGLYTFGFGWKIFPGLEFGYWGGFWEKATALDQWTHNIGIAWK